MTPEFIVLHQKVGKHQNDIKAALESGDMVKAKQLITDTLEWLYLSYDRGEMSADLYKGWRTDIAFSVMFGILKP